MGNIISYLAKIKNSCKYICDAKKHYNNVLYYCNEYNRVNYDFVYQSNNNPLAIIKFSYISLIKKTR